MPFIKLIPASSIADSNACWNGRNGEDTIPGIRPNPRSILFSPLYNPSGLRRPPLPNASVNSNPPLERSNPGERCINAALSARRC